jgi:hypothetical protein
MGSVGVWRAAAAVALYLSLACTVAVAAVLADGMLPPLQRFTVMLADALPGALVVAGWLGPRGAPWGVLAATLEFMAGVAAFVHAAQLQAQARALAERRRRESEAAEAMKLKLRQGDTVRMRVAGANNPEDWA